METMHIQAFFEAWCSSVPSVSVSWKESAILDSCPSPSSWVEHGPICRWVQGSWWRRWWHLTPVLLPGKGGGTSLQYSCHGQRSLIGCSSWCREESDMTERLHFHALEEDMATHSSVLAWRSPGTGEPGGLPSMGSHRVGHDWSDLAAAAAAAAQGSGSWWNSKKTGIHSLPGMSTWKKATLCLRSVPRVTSQLLSSLTTCTWGHLCHCSQLSHYLTLPLI